MGEEETPCSEEAQGPLPEPVPEGGPASERLVVGHATEPGRAQPEKATWLPPPPLLPSRGRPTNGKNRWGWVRCQTGSSEGRGFQWTRPRQLRLALGMWNVTSLGGKEPELVREVERYRVHLVGLTSTHSRGSGTLHLDRGWTLYHH